MRNSGLCCASATRGVATSASIRSDPFRSVCWVRAQDPTLALTANHEYAHCAHAIDEELAEHRSAYETDDVVAIAIAPIYVAVIRLDHRLVLEFGYRVPWDEEHTLGARVCDGKLIELNGSVLEP